MTVAQDETASMNGHHPAPPLPPVSEAPQPGQLDPDQIEQLLRWLDPRRVIDDGRGHATVAAQDVKAHLTRIFGFSGWRHEVADRELMFCEERIKDGAGTGRWDACYRAEVVLEIYNRRGELVTRHREGNMSTEYGRYRGAALQLAYTSAISLALKRAAAALGDQFGLSLYNGGSLRGVVGAVLGAGSATAPQEQTDEAKARDVQQVAPAPIADDMDGADPDDPAEMERMQAYQAARRTARDTAGESGGQVADAPAGEDERRAWLMDEVAFLNRLVPGLAARIALRLDEPDELDSAPLAELAAVVAPMRFIVAVPLRKGGHHDAADRYQSASATSIRPLAELLGCDPADIVGPDWRQA